MLSEYHALNTLNSFAPVIPSVKKAGQRTQLRPAFIVFKDSNTQTRKKAKKKALKPRSFGLFNGDCVDRVVRQTGLEVRQCNFMNCRHFQKLPILRHFDLL